MNVYALIPFRLLHFTSIVMVYRGRITKTVASSKYFIGSTIYCTVLFICNNVLSQQSPRMARSRAVSFPIPVLAPVMRTVFPSRVAVDWHTPPAAYFLWRHDENWFNTRSTVWMNCSRYKPCPLQDWTHGQPGLIIHRETWTTNCGASYDWRHWAQPPRNQWLRRINAYTFNSSHASPPDRPQQQLEDSQFISAKLPQLHR